MRLIKHLILTAMGMMLFSLPLGGRPHHQRPTIVLPQYRFGEQSVCNDPGLRVICDEIRFMLPEIKTSIETEFQPQGEYDFRTTDDEFDKAENTLTIYWRTHDHQENSKRPYIIEAKVIRMPGDKYYIEFHGRLIGERLWHIPKKCPKNEYSRLIELGPKYRVQAQDALEAVCEELLVDWKQHNEE